MKRVHVVLALVVSLLAIGCDGPSESENPATQPGAATRTSGERVGQEVSDVLKRAGQAIQENADDVGQAIQRGIDSSEQALERGSREAQDAWQRGTEAASRAVGQVTTQPATLPAERAP
jgi:hypothetical protein